MEKLLDLYFDNKKEKLSVYTTANGLEETGELSKINIFYEINNEKVMLIYDYLFNEVEDLKNKIEKALSNKLLLHKSIQNYLGYYQSKYYKKNKRKDLSYRINDKREEYWIGYDYFVFSSSGREIPATWVYNNKEGNIVLEFSFVYPWIFDCAKSEEKGIYMKYSDWMKNYPPGIRKTISKDVAKQWIKQLDELIEIVLKVSATLPCAGLLDCICCVKEEKANA